MKYQRYAAYKESGVEWLGEVPEHWKLNRFKNIFRIRKRIAGKLGFDILSITQKGVKIKDTESGDGQLSMDYSKYQLVYQGDYAMNHMDLLTGFIDISKYDGVTSPDYRVFTLEDKNSNKRYYLYLSQLCYIAKIFYPLGQGAANIGRWRLPTEAFNEFIAPLPYFDEQQKIANFLDHETAKIDTLIEKQRRLIELLKEKRQAVISHAVTPKPDEETTKLGHLIELKAGYSFQSQLFSQDENHIRLLRGINVGVNECRWDDTVYWTGEIDDKIQDFSLQQDDIVLGMDRPWISSGTRVTQISKEDLPCLLVQRVARIRAKLRQSQIFIHLLLSSNEFKSYLESDITGVSVPHISPEQICSFPVRILAEDKQIQVATETKKKLLRLDVLISKVECSIELSQERRTALISAAVTGKIDVRNWQTINKEAAA